MRIALVVAAVLVGLLVALVGYAPASMADWGLQRVSNGRLALAEADGTVWDGSARLVLVDIGDRTRDGSTIAGVAVPGRINWQVKLLPLALTIIDAQVRVDGMSDAIQLSGGLGELRISGGQLSLPSVDLGRLGSPWNTIRPSGALALRWDGLQLRQGSFTGRATWNFATWPRRSHR